MQPEFSKPPAATGKAPDTSGKEPEAPVVYSVVQSETKTEWNSHFWSCYDSYFTSS